MAAEKKLPSYMRDNNGSWAYRRRVPKRHHKTLGLKVWNEPCGKATFAEAVAMVLERTKQHDNQIELLDDTTFGSVVRRETEDHYMKPKVSGLIDAMQTGALPSGFDPLKAAIAGLKAIEENPEFDDHDRLVRYRAIMEASFGDHVVPPKDIDERDYFDLIKRKLYRRIVEIDGDPNTISAVSEKAFEFAKIKTQVRNKYRRNIKMLINHTGDIPVAHLTASLLREFRDTKSTLESSAVTSLFTPIKTMMKYAVDQEIILDNPLVKVSMPRENCSLDEIRWKPFPPEEAQRIFDAIDQYWTKPIPGMKEDRRKAIWWVTRVQAFTDLPPETSLVLM